MRRLRFASLAIGLLAGSIIMFELALIRVFSFVLWHHFAFMVISVALLGFGVSGIVLYLWPRLGEPAHARASVYAGLFALTAPAATAVLVRVPLDFRALGQDPAQLAYVLLDYAILVVPFAFAGLGVAVLLKGYAAQAGRVYGSDLLGSAVGCLLVVFGTDRVGTEGIVVAAAAAAALAAAVLALPVAGGRLRPLAWVWIALGVLATLMVVPTSQLWRVAPGAGKALDAMLEDPGHPDARIAFSRWSALFRTDVVENDGYTVWTFNPAAPHPLPTQHQIVIDGDASTPLIRLDTATPDSLSFLDYTLSSLGPQALRPQRALVIGSGGGVDVLTALHHGALHVDAVEVNADVAQLVTGHYSAWLGGLFDRDDVTLHVAEGRSFVTHTSETFDMIQLSLVDTWAASAAGALSLTESYLYTVEAFEDYLAHLSDDGILTVSRWRRVPPRETMRLVTVATAALESIGVERPERHIVVCALDNLGNLLVKRSPFNGSELEAIRAVAQQRGFEVIYAPDGQGDADPFLARYLHGEDKAGFVEAYPFDVRPSVDDRPFFFQFGRWRDLPAVLLGRSGIRPVPLTGTFILAAVLLQGIVFSLLLLCLPLAFVKRGERGPTGWTPRIVWYFLLIGIAFMLFEITLMQRFTLYLGHPVFGIALVLATLLLGAGWGSLMSARTVPLGRSPESLFAVIVVLGVIHAMAVPWLFKLTLGLPLVVRCLIGVLLILPMGFVLGTPFPAAMARIEQGAGSRLIAWAWAANACGSVLGPLLAMMLAIDLGYLKVTLGATALYGVAYLVFGKALWLGVAEGQSVGQPAAGEEPLVAS